MTVKIRWTGDDRSLADPQVAVTKGDVVEVDGDDAKSFVDQGLAVKVTKKEND